MPVTTNAYPYDGYRTSDAEYSQLFHQALGGGGIVQGQEPSFTAPGGLVIGVSAFAATVRGHWVQCLGGTLDLVSVSQPRIASLIARLDYTAVPIVTVDIKYGSPGASPQAPGLTQTPQGIFEYGLADVLVPGGATVIGAAAITPRWQLHRLPTAQRMHVQEQAPQAPREGDLWIW